MKLATAIPSRNGLKNHHFIGPEQSIHEPEKPTLGLRKVCKTACRCGILAGGWRRALGFLPIAQPCALQKPRGNPFTPKARHTTTGFVVLP
jgi:hypothetical protein